MPDRRLIDIADDEAAQGVEAAKTAGLLETLDRLRGVGCVACSRPLCGHEALFSVFMGVKDAPRCLPCLAQVLGWAPVDLRDQLADHFQGRDCYRQAWAVASQQEGLTPTPHPACLWPEGRSGEAAFLPHAPALPGPAEPTEGPPVQEWDAGHMGCGELVLALLIRLRAVAPGEVLRVTARDPAAPEDLPAWCRLTGHHLVRANHPTYDIQRKGQ